MLKFQNNNTTLIANFEDFILTVFVFMDELYQEYVPDSVSKRRNVLTAKLTDSEIITISICGELAGIDSENAWFSFVKRNYKHHFPNLCSRSRFNRTRRSLIQTTELLREKLLSVFSVSESRYFIVDSFPLEVCKFGRAHFCRSFRGYGADYGMCPSKKQLYFGYKVHALVTLEGFIMALKRSNSKNNYPKSVRQLIFRLRRRIETVFSQLSEQLNAERVLAKSFQGLCTRLLNKILAHNLCMILNRLFGETYELGKIKQLIF